MNRTEKLIYLAGFVDGEGCLTRNISRNTVKYRPQLRISGTYKPVMEWIKRWFGGNYYTIHRRTAKTKTTYDWVISTNQAIALVNRLMPYLKVKKREAKVFVAFYKADKATCERLAKRLSALKRLGWEKE